MIEIELCPERYSRANQKGPMPKIMEVTLDPKVLENNWRLLH